MMYFEAVKRLADSVWRGREPVNALMDELARYICPDARGFQSEVGPGEEGRDDIWDSTPEEAAGLLAAALGSLLTNPATNWFSLDLADGEDAGGETGLWLTHAARVMLEEMAAPEAGFYQEIDAFYMHLASLAWAVMFIEYKDGRGLSFKNLPPRECALAENADGLVDTVVRRFSMTAAQIKEEFGEEGLSKALQSALEKEPQKRFTVNHLVLPKAKLPKAAPDAANAVLPKGGAEDDAFAVLKTQAHTYASIVYEQDAEKPLHVGGYFSFPFVAPRWSKRAGEVYGRGPGHASLPDIRVLNRVSASQLDAAEKASNTPILAPDDSVIDRKINTFPGGITWYRPSGGEFMPLPVAADLSTMQAVREERKDAIRRLFLNDRILLASGPDMTATEVLARENRQMQSLSPVLGRLQSSECLGRLVQRVFDLLWRNGRLDNGVPEGPPPGRKLRVRYVSPVTMAQKRKEAENFMQAMQFAAPLVQLRPDLTDHFDLDVILRDTREMFGYAPKYLRDEESVEQLRLERAGAMQAQAAAATGAGQIR